MIETLRIKNLILVDECFIEFKAGLTIITGETGAGKTALTQALHLLAGERADISMLRKGEDKALVEGCFDVRSLKHIHSILDQLAVDFNLDEPLILTRELSKEGRSRAFINRQAVPLFGLQMIASALISLIGQNSCMELRSSDALRQTLDTFGALEEELSYFQRQYEQSKRIRTDLEKIESELLDKERNQSKCEAELEEIISSQLKEDEEEELFSRYSFASKSQQIAALVDEMTKGLTGPSRPMIRELSSYKAQCDSLISVHKDFIELSQLYQEAVIALQEACHVASKLGSSSEYDSRTVNALEERLSLYSKIKKKYGACFSDWMSYKLSLENTLKLYDSLDEKKEKLTEQYIASQNELESAARALSLARKNAASKLEEKLTEAICELNMPGAKLFVHVDPQLRGPYGDDTISFWLQANKGETPASTKDSTSGGELSRLLLAIKTILAEKNNTATIVFDEIDANVGGTTATLIACKLKELAKYRQVFCITHFAQVAKKSDQHIRVSKEEKEGRTVAVIATLDNEGKQRELNRMLGEEKMLQNA